MGGIEGLLVRASPPTLIQCRCRASAIHIHAREIDPRGNPAGDGQSWINFLNKLQGFACRAENIRPAQKCPRMSGMEQTPPAIRPINLRDGSRISPRTGQFPYGYQEHSSPAGDCRKRSSGLASVHCRAEIQPWRRGSFRPCTFGRLWGGFVLRHLRLHHGDHSAQRILAEISIRSRDAYIAALLVLYNPYPDRFFLRSGLCEQLLRAPAVHMALLPSHPG